MTSNAKLEALKKQVRDTSNQQMQIQMQRKRAEDAIQEREVMQHENKQEMMQLVRNVFGQSELAYAKERELLKDQLDRFSHRQTLMNNQLIALNDNLTNTTSLNTVYEAKREQLEMDYQNQKEALQGQIDVLEDRLESLKLNLERINEDISINTSKLEEIVAETKKATFKSEAENTGGDKWLSVAIVGLFFGVVVDAIIGIFFMP